LLQQQGVKADSGSGSSNKPGSSQTEVQKFEKKMNEKFIT
jgi:hypothetical protein